MDKYEVLAEDEEISHMLKETEVPRKDEMTPSTERRSLTHSSWNTKRKTVSSFSLEKLNVARFL